MNNTYRKILEETQQSPSIRQKLLTKLENDFNKTIINFSTSFKFPVMIEDDDAFMLEEVLQNTKIHDNGLILIINSPGGLPLAAERIINICKSYSKNEFEVIVPNMAKSAATMICLGSSKIYMSKTSELGPVDPQITFSEDNTRKRLSVHSILHSYDKLLKQAVKSKGRIEPYLQQLSRYDAREIEEMKRAMELSESIVVKYLRLGMMKGMSISEIKKKIKPFLSPIESKSHGRPIFIDQAKKIGLNIEELDLDSDRWHFIWEIYSRADFVLKRFNAKIIESSKFAFNLQTEN